MALMIAALLVSTPAQAKPWQCALWPRSCDAPIAAPVPVPVPAPAPPAARTAPPAAMAKQHRPKPKWKPAPAKARRAVSVALPTWCAFVPAGTALARIEERTTALLGRPMTPNEKQQARACLASKG